MARNGRTLAVTTLTAAMALTLLGGPVAQAQDDKPFCAILTDAEVSAAVGADVAPTYGDDRSCDWASGAEDVYTSLSVTNGGTQLTDAKEFFPGGEDTTVAGAEFPAAAISLGMDKDLVWIEEQCEELERRHQSLRSTGANALPNGVVTARYGFIHALDQEALYRRDGAGGPGAPCDGRHGRRLRIPSH